MYLFSQSGSFSRLRKSGFNLFMFEKGSDQVAGEIFIYKTKKEENVSTDRSISILCDVGLESFLKATPCFMVVGSRGGYERLKI